jgi:hypothetical protein
MHVQRQRHDVLPVSERFAALHVMTQDETITRRQAHMSAYRAFSVATNSRRIA